MKFINKIFVSLSCFILVFLYSCCSARKTETLSFVGIAIYQKLQINQNWNTIKENPNTINNIVSTQENELVINENPTTLFYFYNDNLSITNYDKLNYKTNTTIKSSNIKDSNLTIEFERILEDTDILIYLIYKSSNGKYKLVFNQKQDNITKEQTNIIIELNEKGFSQINLHILKFGSFQKEY